MIFVWVLLGILPTVINAQKVLTFPVVLPPLNDKDTIGQRSQHENWGSCLLYVESVTVYVFSKKSTEPMAWGARIASSDANGKNKFSFNADNVNCLTKKEDAKQKFTFKLDVDVQEAVDAVYKEKKLFSVQGKIPITLTFTTEPGHVWRLEGLKVEGLKVSRGSDPWLSTELTADGDADAESVKYMNLASYGNYNYACSQTKAAIFRQESSDFEVGIGFGNIQIQAFGYAQDKDNTTVHFSHNVHDCQGTFSTGSWMGIIVALVLASVLMFGYLMLNSVQTVDRFDDPKQKQLIINAKD